MKTPRKFSYAKEYENGRVKFVDRTLGDAQLYLEQEAQEGEEVLFVGLRVLAETLIESVQTEGEKKDEVLLNVQWQGRGFGAHVITIVKRTPFVEPERALEKASERRLWPQFRELRKWLAHLLALLKPRSR